MPCASAFARTGYRAPVANETLVRRSGWILWDSRIQKSFRWMRTKSRGLLMSRRIEVENSGRAKKGVVAATTLWSVLLGMGAAPGLGEKATQRPIEFNRDIRSILSENCFACHGPDKSHRKADLRSTFARRPWRRRRSFRANPRRANSSPAFSATRPTRSCPHPKRSRL